MKVVCTLVFAGFLLGVTVMAQARTYVVDGGSAAAQDANPGTAAQPFKTIGRAAKAAQAGDLVLIRPGAYAEAVEVKNSGLPGKPIVFQATVWHGVTVTAPDDHTYTLFQPGKDTAGHRAAYVTVRGIVFAHTAFRGWSGYNDFPNTVRAGHGWRVEDCVLRDNMGLSFGNGGGEDSNDVTLLRTIFEECNSGGAGASGDGSAHPPRYLQGARIINCIFRRNNPKNLDPGGYNGANKFLWHNGLVMDGVISYDNNGSGTWFDYGSTNFTVRNCTFFGNHAGYFLGLDGKPGGSAPWSAVGFWSEANPGPGLIENNVCYSNLASGIGDLDSGSKGAIVIRNNWLVANGGAGVEMRGMDDGGARRLGPAQITGNVFKANHAAWGTSVEQNVPSETPAGMGIVLDRNRYDIAPDASSVWASWKPTKAPAPIQATGLTEIQSKFGAEAHGMVGPASFRGPLIHVFEYPTKADALNPDPAKLNQVPSAGAERLSIDKAIAQAHAIVGREVVIPVFGHTPLLRQGDKAECEVYDLQARYVRLTLPDASAQRRFEANVTPYAIIAPTYLRVRLTYLDPYRVEAVLATHK